MWNRNKRYAFPQEHQLNFTEISCTTYLSLPYEVTQRLPWYPTSIFAMLNSNHTKRQTLEQQRNSYWCAEQRFFFSTKPRNLIHRFQTGSSRLTFSDDDDDDGLRMCAKAMNQPVSVDKSPEESAPNRSDSCSCSRRCENKVERVREGWRLVKVRLEIEAK